MAADDVGPFERGCLCAGWRGLVSEHWDEPEVFAPPGCSPLLMVPAEWQRRGWRDLAFAVGSMERFLGRYGWLTLVRCLVLIEAGVDPWPAGAARGGEQAAD